MLLSEENEGLRVNSFIVISLLILEKEFGFLILVLLNTCSLRIVFSLMLILMRCSCERKIRAYGLIFFRVTVKPR